MNAQEFATIAHNGQYRWDGETPYITHPAAVAALVEHLGRDYRDVAWLHDVIEDCAISEAQLYRAGFSYVVIENVIALTKVKGQSYLDFVLRCCRHPISRAVKLADIHHNLSTCGTSKVRDKYLLAQWIINHHD